LLAKTTFKNWLGKRKKADKAGKKVYLFCDEFTNYLDVEIGKKAELLLERLGYDVLMSEHQERVRSYLSEGLVKQAALLTNKNIVSLSQCVSENTPLIGIEPSAILTIRDEYIDLANQENKEIAKELAKHTFTIEEFLCMEYRNNTILASSFTSDERKVAVHGH